MEACAKGRHITNVISANQYFAWAYGKAGIRNPELEPETEMEPGTGTRTGTGT